MISFVDRPSLLRRPAWARVGGWELIWVMTIRHRAWLACRSPPGLGPVAGDLSRGCRQGGGRAQVRPGSLGAQPLGMVARGNQQHRRGVGADAIQREQARGAGGHQGNDDLIEAGQLAVQELGAAAELAQRQQGVVADHAARGGAAARPARRPVRPAPAR